MTKNPIYFWIDHTADYPTSTGMQRVTRCLARAFMDNEENVVFVRWNADRKSLVLATRRDLENFSQFGGPRLEGALLVQYPSEGEVRELHMTSGFGVRGGWLFVSEVTHITYHEVAPTLDAILYARHYGLKSAFLFYDAIPLKIFEYSDSAEAHATYMQQIAMADLVIPISQFAACDYVAYLNQFACFDGRSLPVVSPVSLPGEIPGFRRADRLEPRSGEIVILSVGTVEPRKNQVALIGAFDRLCAKHPDLSLRLVLVGHLHPAVAERVHEAIGRNSSISHLGYVTDSKLATLYNRSAFTVFPSIEEGFGLPILESLWHGKPCICANFGAMSEAAREEGCVQVNVHSVDEIADAMDRLVTDENRWRDLAHEALTRRIKTWRAYGGEVSGLLRRADEVKRAERMLYWVEHTCTFPYNTGIQRVVRLLAKSLLAEGIELVPVKWDAEKAVFVLPTRSDLDHLALWSGPNPDAWTLSDNFAGERAEWLLIPELTAYPSGPDLRKVVEYVGNLGIRSSIIFYDAIPYKMPECCSPLATTLHTEYMRQLDRFHVVLPISENSRRDLWNFFVREKTRLIGLDDRIVAIRLPGEVADQQRATRHDEPSDDVIRILSVGTVEKRKNHVTMFKAFLAATKRTARKAQLTVVGRVADDLRDELERHVSLGPTIEWVDHVDDARLRELYSSCHFTVYPSLEEGFGLPILESLWCGKPCICRDQGVMAEVAKGGGCIVVDTADEVQLAEVMAKLIDSRAERIRLGNEATSRTFKTWQDYCREILTVLSNSSARFPITAPVTTPLKKLYAPLLSICITTYNRAAWLDVSLKQLTKLISPYSDVVELIVCDNASTDDTGTIAAQHVGFPGFRYFRNRVNVGMLGNLRETAQHARGRFVWILGDDDIVHAGALERVLEAIIDNPSVALIYLNYGYTRHDAPRTIQDIEGFLSSAIPIVPPCEDRCAPIAQLATMSENFFTAIYCLVFRRDHGIKAYSQDIVGRPFSSLLTCIPTAYYVCTFMFEEMGYWIGEPCVVINMNVSWMKYAPLWVLERLPELYELAEMRGADPVAVDRWRVHNLPGALEFFSAIYFEDALGNLEYFSFERFVRRHKHLPEFQTEMREFFRIYQKAFDERRVGSDPSPKELVARFGLSVN